MFATAVLAAPVALLLVAAGVPNFNTKATCRGAHREANQQAIEGCIRSEQAARDELVKRWREFRAEDKTNCVALTRMGGPSSYVELITCLEMANDVRAIRAREAQAKKHEGQAKPKRVRKARNRAHRPRARS